MTVAQNFSSNCAAGKRPVGRSVWTVVIGSSTFWKHQVCKGALFLALNSGRLIQQQLEPIGDDRNHLNTMAGKRVVSPNEDGS